MWNNLLFCPILYIVFAQRLNVVNRGSRRVNSVNWYPSLIPINRDQWCLLDTCYVIDCFNRTMENQRPDSGNALAKDEDEAYRLFSFELVTCKRGGRDTNIHRVVLCRGAVLWRMIHDEATNSFDDFNRWDPCRHRLEYRTFPIPQACKIIEWETIRDSFSHETRIETIKR